MSYRFDKSEVPQFDASLNEQPCVACQDLMYPVGLLHLQDTDDTTGLCRPCWRIVILGPAMESQP